MQPRTIYGRLYDVVARRILFVALTFDTIIREILEIDPDNFPEARRRIIIPGFVDAHQHFESTLLSPAEAARMSLRLGVIAQVADPHEIANVCGLPGVLWVLNNLKSVPFKACVGAPSCVPATHSGWENAGAELDADAVRQLLARPDIGYLAEVMNWPGVLQRDPRVMAKIRAAQALGKPIDGHAPGLRGDQARDYILGGPSTDHECFTLAEALDKLAHGMKIIMREGSAARNLAALHPLIESHPEMVMFGTDDCHPDTLAAGQLRRMIRFGQSMGYDLMTLLRIASYNPVKHYKLPVGLLQVGDPADFLTADCEADLWLDSVYVDGQLVAQDGNVLIPFTQPEPINNFSAQPIAEEALRLPVRPGLLKVIGATDGQLVTNSLLMPPLANGGFVISDPSRDLLKLVCLNRYVAQAAPGIGFIHGLGLHEGALASSVAHDCHNIVAAGCTDHEIALAINLVIENKGALVVVQGKNSRVLPLPLGGLMSDATGGWVANRYSALEDMAQQGLGSKLQAPLMTLSFMCLSVIRSLKLTDRGLFDGEKFELTDLFSLAN